MHAALKNIDGLILAMRGERVVLDADLARIYGVGTRVLNQAVKRNRAKFPRDFMFQLTAAEKMEVITNCDHLTKLKFSRQAPFAFTEHGSIMAASVLKSPRAVQMSVFVVRAFVKLRRTLAESRDLGTKLKALEMELKNRMNMQESAIVSLLQRLMDVLDPPVFPRSYRRKIGFQTNDGERKSVSNNNEN